MGCVIEIPKRDWLSCVQTRQEERSPVGTQRIVSIPEKGLASTTRVEFPRLTSLMTFETIALLSAGLFNSLTKIKTLITVIPNGLKIIDTPRWVKYLCIGEVLAFQAEQRARVGTQRCIPSPLIIQDRLARFCSLPVLGPALRAWLPARASPLKSSRRDPMSKVSREAFDAELVQLTIPFNAKPFLEFKKRVRGRNRTAFDKIQEGAQDLKYALQRNEIQSTEARLAVREFLKTLGLK